MRSGLEPEPRLTAGLGPKLRGSVSAHGNFLGHFRFLPPFFWVDSAPRMGEWVAGWAFCLACAAILISPHHADPEKGGVM